MKPATNWTYFWFVGHCAGYVCGIIATAFAMDENQWFFAVLMAFCTLINIFGLQEEWSRIKYTRELRERDRSALP